MSACKVGWSVYLVYVQTYL